MRGFWARALDSTAPSGQNRTCTIALTYLVGRLDFSGLADPTDRIGDLQGNAMPKREVLTSGK